MLDFNELAAQLPSELNDALAHSDDKARRIEYRFKRPMRIERSSVFEYR